MTLRIDSLTNAVQPNPGAAGPERSTGQGFADTLKQAVDQVNRQQQTADRAIAELSTGRQADIHGTMIAMEKASLSFQLLMQVRNKVIGAYETVMRMNV